MLLYFVWAFFFNLAGFLPINMVSKKEEEGEEGENFKMNLKVVFKSKYKMLPPKYKTICVACWN